MSSGFLGLGSNIGDRRAHLQASVDTLARHGVQVLRSSATYDTEPVGLILDQPEFLNACIEIETEHGPLELLDACKEVEREVGRAAGGPRHGPRVIDVDRGKAEQAGVNVADLFDAIQAELGSKYVNDFTYQNHTYHVYVQGDTNYRATFDDLDKIFVTSANGATSPITDFLTTRQETSPPIITHYNLFRNVEITGQTPRGLGTKQSLDEMEALSTGLPGNFQHEWSGISLEQIQGGGASAIIFALGLLFVFFVLAAQYESLSEPFIILLATPVALLGALIALQIRGLASDVYSQVGFVLLIGLASKNAILIVEFANQLRSEGRTALEAVTEAAEIRLRPILMTSFAFILGIVPLVVASGAGASSRHSLGTAILGGMIVSTILNLAIIPALYLIVARFDKRHEPVHPSNPRPGLPSGSAGPVPVETT